MDAKRKVLLTFDNDSAGNVVLRATGPDGVKAPLELVFGGAGSKFANGPELGFPDATSAPWCLSFLYALATSGAHGVNADAMKHFTGWSDSPGSASTLLGRRLKGAKLVKKFGSSYRLADGYEFAPLGQMQARLHELCTPARNSGGAASFSSDGGQLVRAVLDLPDRPCFVSSPDFSEILYCHPTVAALVGGAGATGTSFEGKSPDIAIVEPLLASLIVDGASASDTCASRPRFSAESTSPEPSETRARSKPSCASCFPTAGILRSRVRHS